MNFEKKIISYRAVFTRDLLSLHDLRPISVRTDDCIEYLTKAVITFIKSTSIVEASDRSTVRFKRNHFLQMKPKHYQVYSVFQVIQIIQVIQVIQIIQVIQVIQVPVSYKTTEAWPSC